MMDVEILLENWCKRKGINPENIPDRIWHTVISRTEDDINEFLIEKNEELDFVNEWAWMEIEQRLEEHPEWKEKKNSEV